MSTATATRNTQLFGADLQTRTFTGHQIDTLANGTKVVRGVEIFRAGTFRDSMGEQKTWTAEHLKLMAQNFKLLRESGIFPDVPVRRDHSWTIDKVMGYFEDVYVKGDKLVADYTVATPEDLQNLVSGKYRSRSLEVGMYTTNDEADYWPVIYGVAYVDIPAVEGLHSKDLQTSYFSRSNDSQETNVDPTNDKGAARPNTFRINGQETTDAAAVQAYIAQLEARPGLATFKIAGAETTDASAVQAHIDALEAFRSDARDGARKAFVKGLVTDGKIVAPMEETFSKLVTEMSDEQFAAFKAGYDLAPKVSLLGNHGANANHSSQDPAGAGQPSEELVLEESIRMHREAGMSEEQIQNTKSYKKLMALRAGKS